MRRRAERQGTNLGSRSSTRVSTVIVDVNLAPSRSALVSPCALSFQGAIARLQSRQWARTLDLILRDIIDDPDCPAVIDNGGVVTRLLTAALERTNVSRIVDMADAQVRAVTGNAASQCPFERLSVLGQSFCLTPRGQRRIRSTCMPLS